MAPNIYEKGFTNPKTISKSEKYKTFYVSKLLIWRQNGLTQNPRVNKIWWWWWWWCDCVECREVKVVLFWIKYAVPFQIKPGIINLTIISIFVSGKDVGYYCVVSVGHPSFDCGSYCGCSYGIKGSDTASDRVVKTEYGKSTAVRARLTVRKN